MTERNKCNTNILFNLLMIVFVSFSFYVLIGAYKYKKNGNSLQKRLQKAYEGLSPVDYD